MDNNITDPNFRYPLDRLIPFDIEEAKKPGTTFSTRDGRPVTILAFDAPGVVQPVVGVMTGSTGSTVVTQWRRDGGFWERIKDQHRYDLHLVRKTKTLYAVQYVAHFPSGYMHLSAVGVGGKEAAETAAADLKATIKDKDTPNCLWYSDVEIITREVPV